MQGPDTQKSNVVSLFSAREEAAKKAESDKSASPDAAASEESFQDVMERNHKNAERLRKERQNANKSVLRSYRIKH